MQIISGVTSQLGADGRVAGVTSQLGADGRVADSDPFGLGSPLIGFK